MNRTKSEHESPRWGQLGRFRKVSNQAPQVEDFFGVDQQAKSDVHGIPEWENPMLAGSGQGTIPVKPKKPQRSPSRKVERHWSAPVYKLGTEVAVSADARETAFNPPPRLPQRTSSGMVERKHSYGSSPLPATPDDSSVGNRNFENMDIECNNEDDGIDATSIGDITFDTFASAEPRYNDGRGAFQQPSMKPLSRRSSPERRPVQPPRRRTSLERIGRSNSYHGAGAGASSEFCGINHRGTMEQMGAHHSHHERPLSAFGPRRKVSICRPMVPAPPRPPRPSSSARTFEEEEEERMIQLAMERSLHVAEAFNHTRMSTSLGYNGSERSERSFASPTTNNSSHTLSSAGCHLSMIAAQMKRGRFDGCSVQRSNSDGPVDPNFVWRKEAKRWVKIHVDDLNTDSPHAIQEQDDENNYSSPFVARPPARTISLNPGLAMRRLRGLEREKRVLEQAMSLSMAAPPHIEPDSPTSMSDEDEEVVVNELQEEELLAEALIRSMQEM